MEKILIVFMMLGVMSCEKEEVIPTTIVEEVVTVTPEEETTEPTIVEPTEKYGTIVINLFTLTYGTWETTNTKYKLANSSDWIESNGNNINTNWIISSGLFNGMDYLYEVPTNKFYVESSVYEILELEVVQGTMILESVLGNGITFRYELIRIS